MVAAWEAMPPSFQERKTMSGGALWLKISVLLLGIEAGTTSHRVEDIMPQNHGLGKLPVQAFQEFTHRLFLRIGAGVCLFALSVQPALVTDADAVLVMV